MVKYTLSYEAAHRHELMISVTFPTHGQAQMELQLPRWRPGRYELGNFAKNLLRFEIDGYSFEAKGNHTWLVQCEGAKEITVDYVYYAAELNAGSTYLTAEQLYVNPVNCFLYNSNFQDEASEVQLVLPEDYLLFGGMKQTAKHQMQAKNVQELMDCPFMAAAEIEHWTYTCEGIPFHICLLGKHHLNKEKVIREFSAFTQVQLEAFGGFPVDEYYFLFQLPPFPVRHGVEHENSTVISLGPVEEVHEGSLYKDFLGISSHELYHTWNVKSIRPKEMMPYDFSKENYSRLGYVAEGVSTYYGDEMLHRSGVFSDETYLATLEEQLHRHFWNWGWMNKSVADSSYETWLDGYERGVPGRKVSIYTEGCLIAFICDEMIKEASEGKLSLDDVMKLMWEKYGKKGIGYSEEDYWSAMSEVLDLDYRRVRKDLVSGTKDYGPYLERAFRSAGILWEQKEIGFFETHLGLRLLKQGEQIVVWDVYPKSPADLAGLWVGDVLIALNEHLLDENWNASAEVINNKDTLNIKVLRRGTTLSHSLKCSNQSYFLRHSLSFQQ